MRGALTSLLSFLLAWPALAQVRSDKPIVLTGDAPEQRQVTGVPASTAPDAVLGAAVDQAGTHRHADALPGAAWQVDVTGLDQAPTAGTHLTITVPAGASGPITLLVNGNGPYALEWAPTEPVSGEEVPEGTVLSVVFDGTAFQALNGRTLQRRPCPSGMAEVNEQFCIEPQQRYLPDFEQSIMACAGAGRRLCTWAEFHTACAHAAELGMVANLSGDWEWTNDTANEISNVRMVRMSNCQSAGTRNAATGPGPSRCCFTR